MLQFFILLVSVMGKSQITSYYQVTDLWPKILHPVLAVALFISPTVL